VHKVQELVTILLANMKSKQGCNRQ